MTNKPVTNNPGENPKALDARTLDEHQQPQKRMKRTPRIGADVIFCTREEGAELVENAAKIVKVHDGPLVSVDLHVLYQNGEQARVKRVLDAEGLEPGRWRWPQRSE